MDSKQLLEDVLLKVAQLQNFENFDVVPDEDVLRGDGFLSEFYTGTVNNKSTGESVEVYVKFPPKSTIFLQVSEAYANEHRFYANIWKKLDEFQREKNVKVPFDTLPKFFCGDVQSETKYIALENLKSQGYELLEKEKPISKEHLELLFETYGRFHALSVAFKDQNAEIYEELTRPLKDLFPRIIAREDVSKTISTSLKVAQEKIKETNEEAAEKVGIFIENFKERWSQAWTYEGKYTTLTHGDCWSNNMLFKHHNGQVQDVKLLDFQMARNSTPVHELSYLFYSGASKEDLDQLDSYLELYYNSFCSFSKELGSTPETILPLEAIKSEWRRYSVMGIAMSLLIWQMKFLEKDRMAEISSGEMTVKGMTERMMEVLRNDTFRTTVGNILLHAVEYGII